MGQPHSVSITDGQNIGGIAGIEVSSLDYANAITLSGFRIPAIKKDSVSTSVDLRDGETFVIAGLINEEWSKNLDKLPLLGDIPILGAFFRDQRLNKTERELVFLVTPKIMKPMKQGERVELPGSAEPTERQIDDLRWMPLLPSSHSLDPEQLK
jgi:pilus assembly protein CpaC